MSLKEYVATSQQLAGLFTSYHLQRFAIRCFHSTPVSRGGKLNGVLCVLEKSVGFSQCQKIESCERKDQGGRGGVNLTNKPSIVLTATHLRRSLYIAEHFYL